MKHAKFKTADLCDEFAGEIQVCEPMLRSFGKRRRFSGRISTVRAHEDNVLVREALEAHPPGTVLVVDGGGSRRCALLGGRLAAIAVERGLGGVVINGCVRDSVELSEMEIGILALASHPLPSGKSGEGEVDAPVEFGGVVWTPGEYVYADEDGIVISAESILEKPS